LTYKKQYYIHLPVAEYKAFPKDLDKVALGGTPSQGRQWRATLKLLKRDIDEGRILLVPDS
jgi:hypothetical protein